MASFLFVPGAWHSGWCFDGVVKALRGRKHRALAVDLPGVAGDEAALAAQTLEGWGRHVAQLAQAQPGPVLLCGHSRGGVVISAAAEHAPRAVQALVYIAAFMLPDRESVASFKSGRPAHPAAAGAISVVGENAGTRIDPAAAAELLYNTTPPARRDAAIARLAADPYHPSRTALRLSRKGFGSVPRYYVECAQDRVIPLAEQRLMQEILPVAAVETLSCDHSPFLSAAQELAEALERIAARAHAPQK